MSETPAVPVPSPLKRALVAIDDLKARLDAAERRSPEPIAIVGLGCRFPGGADTPERFWNVMRDGIDAVTEVPKARFDIDSYYDPKGDVPGKTTTRYGAFVDGIFDFDPAFFGMAPVVVASMDPQQRLFMAVCWEALENAGIAPSSLDGSATGVFAGVWSVEYWQRLASRGIEQLDANVARGNLHSLVSGNVSHFLGLKGPSLTLDTACSASLVAVDLAVQGLRSGACDLALAGGVNLLLGPENYVCFAGIQVIASDGRCKAFDASADGFGRGEGAGAVVLKRLSDAQRDGDRVLAVIHGSAVNQDGRSSGFGVPNGPSQADAGRKALAQAGIEPADVHFVEAHGTGTALGDPIEVIALDSVYGKGRSSNDPLLLGTVKTNIAHLESAAGVAALIKVVLAFQHEALPGNLHFQRPNPEIPWDRLNVKVVTRLVPWPRGERPRYASVSSFGVSGTNAHLVLGEAPLAPPKSEPAAERPRHLLVLSARDRDALVRSAAQLADHLEAQPDLRLADVCHTANTGRSAFRERVALVAGSIRDLREGLDAFAKGSAGTGLVTGKSPAAGPPALAFMFTGQGSQAPHMGRRLYDAQPAFRRALLQCDEILTPLLGRRLVDVLYPAPGADTPLDDTAFTQPALFAFEYALAEMWRSWGVFPSFVMGHSVGEYVAACVAGVFSLEDGLRLVAARGRLMSALPRDGRMVAVLTDEARVAAAVAPLSRDVSIAAQNGPRNVVVSGRAAVVEKLATAIEAEGVEVRPLNVSHAFHSPLMEPMQAEFERVARDVAFQEPLLPLISNLTGAPAGREIALPEYWISHIRKPVRFADGVARLLREGCALFLEVGPKPVLSGMGADCLSGREGSFLPTLRPPQDDWDRVLLTLGDLFNRGVAVDFKAFDEGYACERVALPTYPWQGQRYWIETGPQVPGRAGAAWLLRLLEAKDEGRLAEALQGTGFSNDEVRLLERLLDRAKGPVGDASRDVSTARKVVGGYYDTFRNLTPTFQDTALDEVTEDYLTFAPFPEILPGYSWILAMVDAKSHPEWARITLAEQKVLREAVFRRVDFSRVRRVLDFGCGYASDLCTLALRHPHLEGTGYTLSVEQMKVGQSKAKKLGLEERVQIFNRDSTKDEFPGTYELAFGFEVAHHVPDKQALFRHIGRHLAERGQVTMADFVSRTGFAIEYDEISSYFPTTEEWVDLLADNQFLLTDAVDISREMGNFLYDPDFDRNVEALEAQKGRSEAIRGLKSYDRLGKMHAQGLALYVLFTAEKRSELSVAELKRRNQEVLEVPTPHSKVSLAHGCYEVSWEPSDRTPSERVGPRSGAWLILHDQGGVGDALASRLKSLGERSISVRRGDAFSAEGPGAFRVDPGRYSDLAMAIQAASQAVSLRGIVHLWSLDTASTRDLDLSSLKAAQLLGCGSIMHLVQAVTANGGQEPPRLFIVTEQGQAVGPTDDVRVAQAPVFGLGKALMVENPELWGGMLDLEAGSVQAKVDAILAELQGPDGECHVAMRGGRRLVPRLQRRSRPALERVPLRSDATYLVAGGTGGLGLRVARWLVEEGARHLVLTSRRGPDDAARAEITALEARGAQVLAVSADVTKEADMRGVIERIAASMPALRGVINAAGSAGGTVLSAQTWERFNETLEVKVAGSFNLHALTRELPLDFFVSFSSAASILATPGQPSYAAANAFQDALAHARVRAGLKGLTVNWGAWAEVGMAATMPESYRKSLLHDRGLGEIDPREAMPLLGALIVEGRPQVAAFPVDWANFVRTVCEGKVPPYLKRIAPPQEDGVEEASGQDLGSPTDAGVDTKDLTRHLQEQVARVLGYKDAGQVDREMTLLELGFDSLMAVQLRNAIRTRLEVDVPIGRLVDSTSIERLADLLRERLASEAGGTHVVDVI